MSKTVNSDEVTYILAHPGFTVLQDIEQQVQTIGVVKNYSCLDKQCLNILSVFYFGFYKPSSFNLYL